MSKKTNNLLLIVSTIILIFTFTPILGSLYEKIIGRNISSGFWGPSHPEYFEGFFMSYVFFITLFTIIFVKNNKYKILSIFLFILFLLNIVSNTWDSLMINILSFIIAFLIAQIILLTYKKVKK